MRMKLSLGSIVQELGGDLHADPSQEITRISPLDSATAESISFISSARYHAQLETTAAGCLIVPPALQSAAQARGACIVHEQPYLYFARLTQWWKRLQLLHRPDPCNEGVHPSAFVHPEAQVHPSAHIGPFCVIQRGASVGADTRLYAHVTLAHDCHIGERCIVHPGVVIGADGFGFAPVGDGTWEKIEQLGAVRIGNDVEIGANTCIDRGALDDTVIEDGVKLDNLIQIAHNVRIGQHTAMAGCSGVAGSSTIGAYCTIGGRASILGHLKLAERVNISTNTVITRSLTQPGLYTGFFPADDNAQWEKNAATLKQLHSLRERVKQLERQLMQPSDPSGTPSDRP